MRVIVLASQKGGSGKTTLAGHLAVQAELAGAGPVALIDTDPQGSLAKWWNARAAETPAFVAARFDSLQADLDALRAQGFKLVFIDTPPAVTKAIAHVVSFADLVVMPTRPSPHDLRAVGATVEIAAAYNKAMIFVINAATARAKITSEAAVALSQHGTVAPVMINHRVDFAASMTDGRTVMEHSLKGPSSKEIQELWGYVDSRLARLDSAQVDFVDPAGFDFEAPQEITPAPAPELTFAPEPEPAPAPAPLMETASAPESEPEPEPAPHAGMNLVALTGAVEEPAPAAAPFGEELSPALDLVLRQIIEKTELLADEPFVPEGPNFVDDAAFDSESVPPPLQENPQQALLEAVQRLRGELDYPMSLEDILPPQDEVAEAGENIDPEQVLREMASTKRATHTHLLNRMIGFGRRA